MQIVVQEIVGCLLFIGDQISFFWWLPKYKTQNFKNVHSIKKNGFAIENIHNWNFDIS